MMILIDISVWIDHLRRPDKTVGELLTVTRVLLHPFVLGEVALGNFKAPQRTLDSLPLLRPAKVAPPSEVLSFINSPSVFGSGIGYVDAHLLASVAITAGSLLWTRDKRLALEAARLNIAADL